MVITDLYWQADLPDWSEAFKKLAVDAPLSWIDLVQFSKARTDMVQTNRLDRLLRQSFPQQPAESKIKPVRLAVLASSTVDHLMPSIRVGALRRNLWLEAFTGDYGQYQQVLVDQTSPLYRFSPDTILFAFDAVHLFGRADPSLTKDQAEALIDQTVDRIVGLWRLARERLGCHVIQQTILPVFPTLGGENEHRVAGSPAALVWLMNSRLRILADQEGVDLLAIDAAAARSGLAAWYDPMLWLRAKQEVSPSAAPLYGDLLGRLLAARRGLSFKCLVLDLDNTLWGGVIGDDGLEGIKLGQGSALGEAHLAFQRYCRDLSRRGVILAVCSKNDEANARAPFDSHPDMLLSLSDIACFVANWNDKPGNIRTIAERLNIGIDSLVFADDNPFERTIVRRELPMVAVPELPEDPALYAGCIADGGYFETVRVTDEDRARSKQYQGNVERERAKESFTDMAGYLKSLDMRLTCVPFDLVGLPRIVQLINKTNQFNLTTRRYEEAEVRRLIDDPQAVTMQLRLVDQLGDNGMISVVIGRVEDDQTLMIDTWLMSCRVLGRQVEQETMNNVAKAALAKGLTRIIGTYLPTSKNGMVRDHYATLGFALLDGAVEGPSRWQLDLRDFTPFDTFITTQGL